MVAFRKSSLLLLILLIAASLVLVACGGSDNSPQRVIQDAYEAVEKKDVEGYLKSHCSKDGLDQDFLRFGFALINKMEFSDMRYTEMSRTDTSAAFRVTGTSTIEILGGETTEDRIDITITVAKQDGRWCITDFTDNADS